MLDGLSDEIVFNVIDKGLSSLGESPKKALWYCLEKDFHFDRRKVPENLEAFQQVLRQFFGVGYGFLDVLFRKYLSEYSGEDCSGYSSFAECVASLRKAGLVKAGVSNEGLTPSSEQSSTIEL
jgi:hypothetical protein